MSCLENFSGQIDGDEQANIKQRVRRSQGWRYENQGGQHEIRGEQLHL